MYDKFVFSVYFHFYYISKLEQLSFENQSVE